MHVEGLGTDLYPELDIWSLAKPILSDWIKAQMNPQKNLKELGQKIPDLLLGAQDWPTLMIDSLNGLKKPVSLACQTGLHELQRMRLQMEHQQKRGWIFGDLMAVSAVCCGDCAVVCLYCFNCAGQPACRLADFQISADHPAQAGQLTDGRPALFSATQTILLKTLLS